MAIRLLYGTSVSGKSEILYQVSVRRAKAHPDQRFLLLVPEQASLIAQEALVVRHPDHALSNIDVLTFNRLSRQIFDKTHTETRELLDDLGKMLLLRLAIEKKGGDLTVLKRSIAREGMVGELVSVISELAQYGVKPEAVQGKLDDLKEYPALRSKLRDIHLLYDAFEELLHERYDMAEERLVRLAEILPKWAEGRNATVFLDGYTGFTPPQYEVLRALVRHCPEVVFSITAGSGEKIALSQGAVKADETDPFLMSHQMAEAIREIAISEHVPFTEKVLQDDATKVFSAEIVHLERHLFRYPEVAYPSETDKIRVARVRNREAEVSYLLSEILSAVRQGCRYRDLAVITDDPEGFREKIEVAFGEAGIPYFIDANKSVRDTVLFHFLECALEVTENSFEQRAVFAFLKNPIMLALDPQFTNIERISEMENYAIALGIRGKRRFAEEWEGTYRHFDASRLPVINDTRSYVIAPLLTFHEAMVSPKATVKERVDAIRRLFSDCKVERALEKLGEEYTNATKDDVQAEYAGVYRYVTEFLERVEAILGGLSIGAPAFRHVVLDCLENAVFGRVPATKDRLVIGNLKRTRLGEVKKIFFLGANDGMLPKDASGAGLINDLDRKILREMELNLAETAVEQAFNAQFYLYLMLTKPAEGLEMIYATSDEEGKAARPAGIVGALTRLFPSVKVESPETDPLYGLNTKGSGFRLLSKALSKAQAGGGTAVPEESRAIFQWFAASEDRKTAENLDRLFHGLFYRYQDEKLPEDLTKALYGEAWNASVSRLEKFADCPYKHFLNYGLNVDEREEYALEARDIGNLYHDSIQRFFEKLAAKGLTWRSVSMEDQETLVEAAVQETAERYNNEIMRDSAKNTFVTRNVGRIVHRCLEALRAQWEASAFTETKSEVAFGPADRLPSMSFTLDNGTKVDLNGRIDRLDLLEEQHQILIRILDYKSSLKKIDEVKLADGRQIQLFLYLQAAMEKLKQEHPDKDIVPASIAYFYLHNPLPTEDGKTGVEEAAAEELKERGYANEDRSVLEKIDRDIGAKSTTLSGSIFKKDGSFSANAPVMPQDQLKALAQGASDTVKALSRAVSEGAIAVSPHQGACDYCPYRSVCGFDEKIPGFRTVKNGVLNGAPEGGK